MTDSADNGRLNVSDDQLVEMLRSAVLPGVLLASAEQTLQALAVSMAGWGPADLDSVERLAQCRQNLAHAFAGRVPEVPRWEHLRTADRAVRVLEACWWLRAVQEAYPGLVPQPGQHDADLAAEFLART